MEAAFVREAALQEAEDLEEAALEEEEEAQDLEEEAQDLEEAALEEEAEDLEEAALEENMLLAGWMQRLPTALQPSSTATNAPPQASGTVSARPPAGPRPPRRRRPDDLSAYSAPVQTRRSFPLRGGCSAPAQVC